MKRNGRWLIYLAYILCCVFCFIRAKETFERSNSCDLLYRVVGSRLMQDDRSAYFYQWKPGEPERYFHFRQRDRQPLNGVTVTPAVLRLNMVFSGPDFCLTARQWFHIEMGLLFLTGLLLLLTIPGLIAKVVGLISFTVFIALSRNFHAHIHVAQLYVLYSLVFAVYYWLLRSSFRYRFIVLGILTVFTGWLRPLFFILSIPLLVHDKTRGFLKGAMATLAGLFILTMSLGDLGHWKEYSIAMNTYAKEIPGTFQKSDTVSVYGTANEIKCIWPALPFDRYGADGFQSVQHYLHNRGISIDASWPFALAAVILVSMLSYWSRRKRTLLPEQLLVLLFLCYILTELLTPANRFPYNLVQWAAALVIVLSGYRSNKIAALMMLAGTILNHSPVSLYYIEQLGELLMVLAAFVFVYRKDPDSTVLSPTGV